MIIDAKIKKEKVVYGITREAAKTSTSSLGKIDKDEYYTSKEILPSDQSRIIEQGKFTYSPLRKALEKQIKTIEKQGRKQIEEIEEDVKQLITSITFAEKEQKNIPLDNLKEIFYELVAKKTGKNEEIHNTVNF